MSKFYDKKISVGAYAKKGVDVNENDLITIANEGKQVEGQYGMKDVFLFKLKSGEEKNINLNQTSINALVDSFGKDATQWVGKQVKVWLITQMVAGKFQKVLYVAHPDMELGAEGFVTKGTAKSGDVNAELDAEAEYEQA